MSRIYRLYSSFLSWLDSWKRFFCTRIKSLIRKSISPCRSKPCPFASVMLFKTLLCLISGNPSNSSIKLLPQIMLQSRLGSGFGLKESLSAVGSSSITSVSHKRSFAMSTALGSMSQAKIEFFIVSSFKLYRLRSNFSTLPRFRYTVRTSRAFVISLSIPRGNAPEPTVKSATLTSCKNLSSSARRLMFCTGEKISSVICKSRCSA